MGSPHDHFKHESLEDPQSLVRYLDALKEGFESGAVLFASDDKTLTLKLNDLIDFQIEARRKNDEIRLSLRFRWQEKSAAAEPKAFTLNIQPLPKD